MKYNCKGERKNGLHDDVVRKQLVCEIAPREMEIGLGSIRDKVIV